MRKKQGESDVTTGFEGGRKRPQAKDYRPPLKNWKSQKMDSLFQPQEGNTDRPTP